MHRCLAIVEVQRAIFREVHHQHRGSAILAILARTCKAFNSVALDVLWATLHSFVFLIKCLPRDLWKIEPRERKLTFQRPMSLRDWEIFFRHSSRVRSLYQSVGPQDITKCADLGEDVVFALSNPPTYGPLLPYLRRLYWDKPTKAYASLLRLLLTPHLATLSLSGCSLLSPEVSILTCIGTVCLSLKTLSIASPKPFFTVLDKQGEKILSEALLYLHALQSLSCPALDETAIIHLSRLPFLADLSLELQPHFLLEKVRPYIAPPAFASLASLTLHVKALSTLTSFLEPMRFKPTAVSFVVATSPTPDALRLFFFALAGACDSEQLYRVSLTTASERPRGTLSQQVTLSTFQSILAFPNVHNFEFDAPCDVALDDDALASIAKHWPGLITLSINATSGWGFPSRVTHRGLIALLARCPLLTEFALAVDFADVDGPHVDTHGRPGDGIASPCVVVANFVTSPITFPITIAAFLSDVCPELEAVKSGWQHGVVWPEADLEEVEMYREKWEEVENLLPAFSAVRKQCVEWATKKVKEAAPA